MPKATINGVSIYYEVHGQGTPLVWSHEFAGDFRSWEPQVRFFSRRYRVVVYCARGYPPSEVPAEPGAYSQDHSVDDLKGLLDHLEIEKAHVGGLSMGGSVALNFGLTYPKMARSLIVAGAGTGSTDPERFRRETTAFADRLESDGMRGMGDYARGPVRIQLLRKDPKGWREFNDQFLAHSQLGSALTLRGVQGRRPSVFELEDALRSLDVPTLVMLGDEDDPCMEPSVFLKRCIPAAGLAVLSRSGHAINLEEPDLFNRTVLDFLTAVECGAWPVRDRGSGQGFLAGS